MQSSWQLLNILCESYDFSSTQINAPKELAKQIIDFTTRFVDAKDLTDKGIEDEPHVTVKYGLTSSKPSDALKELVKNTPRFSITLGGLKIFENEKYDVIFANVLSPQLKHLHNKVCKIEPHENTTSGYNPHLTLAYTKVGQGRKYVTRSLLNKDGQSTLAGLNWLAQKVKFSSKDEKIVWMRLGESIPS